MKSPSFSLSSGSSLTLSLVLSTAKRRRFFTISILSWLTIALLSVVLLIPAVQSILESITVLSTKKTELATITEQVNALSSVDEQEEHERVAVLQTALPPEKPVLPLLFSLDKIAIQSQVGIANFQVSPGDLSGLEQNAQQMSSALAPGVFSLPLQMQVTGNFPNLNTFFKQLDTIVPLVRVTSIEFSGVSGAGTSSASNSGLFRANVGLESLYVTISPDASGEEKVFLTPPEQELVDQLTIAYTNRQTDVALQTTQVASGSATRNLFAQ